MRGSCLCGAVNFEINGPLRSVVACHCNQCRKASGHHVAATQVANEHLTIHGVDEITWYRSSTEAKRGFCRTCGSQLFWMRIDHPFTSIFAGSLDGETGLTMDRQIHTESKGDYYELPNLEAIAQSALAR